jgi:hypothetical protein
MGKCRENAKDLLRQWENAEVMQRVNEKMQRKCKGLG